MTQEEKTIAFLFTRWLATSYADEHLDENNQFQGHPDFNANTAISVLNRSSEHWYKDKLEYFEYEVLPNYKINGLYQDAYEFLK